MYLLPSSRRFTLPTKPNFPTSIAMMRQGTANHIVAYGGPTLLCSASSSVSVSQTLDHDNRIMISSLVLSMILSENRLSTFQIML
jgi:hypothetical protein